MAEKKKSGPKPKYVGVKCMYPECDAPAVQHHLCRLHYNWWPFHMHLHGDKIQDRRVNKAGYVEAKVDGIWCLEHRLVMAKKLGRMLEHSEIVQWLDGNTQNNSLDNLVIMTRAEIAARKKAACEPES
jgi:hypothetical protein